MIAILATTGNGVARASSENGQWAVEFLLGGQDVRCLAADPNRPNIAFAGTQTNGVLRSSDGGRIWTPSGLDGRAIRSLAISKAEPGLVFAGAKPVGLFVSHDDGAHWDEVASFQRVRAWWWRSPAEADLRAYPQAIALSPVDPNIIAVGIEAGAVVRSADGGKTWQGHRAGALRDCHSMIAHATNGDWMYEAGGTGAGVAVSRDGGATWRQPKGGLDRHYGWACAADPARPEVWYASLSPMFTRARPGVPAAHVDGFANAAIYRASSDTGWQRLSGGLPQPLDFMAYGLATDPLATGHIYAGLSNGDVWRSQNFGDAWEQLPFSLKSIHRAMIVL